MRVGEVVFVRQADDQLWPGKVTKLMQDEAEVRLYKINKTQSFRHDHLIPFSPETANQQHPNTNKQLTTACKLASKDFKAMAKVSIPRK